MRPGRAHMWTGGTAFGGNGRRKGQHHRRHGSRCLCWSRRPAPAQPVPPVHMRPRPGASWRPPGPREARRTLSPVVSFDEILTLLVILGVLGVLVAERLSPAFTILAGLVVLLVAGVVDAGEAFSGFSNSAPLTVAALYVVAAAAGRTRVLELLVSRLPSRSAGPREPRGAGDALPHRRADGLGVGLPQQHAHRRHGDPPGAVVVPAHGPLAVALPHAGQLRGGGGRHHHADRHLDQPRGLGADGGRGPGADGAVRDRRRRPAARGDLGDRDDPRRPVPAPQPPRAERERRRGRPRVHRRDGGHRRGRDRGAERGRGRPAQPPGRLPRGGRAPRRPPHLVGAPRRGAVGRRPAHLRRKRHAGSSTCSRCGGSSRCRSATSARSDRRSSAASTRP